LSNPKLRLDSKRNYLNFLNSMKIEVEEIKEILNMIGKLV
jgi:hypothetical protein